MASIDPNLSIVLTDKNFAKEVVKASAQMPVAVYFWHPQHSFSTQLLNVWQAVAAELKNTFTLASLNCQEYPEFAKGLGIKQLPYLKVIKHGAPAGEVLQAASFEECLSQIEKFLPNDADTKFIQRLQDLVDTGQNEACIREIEQYKKPELAAARPIHIQAKLNLGEISDAHQLFEKAEIKFQTSLHGKYFSALFHFFEHIQQIPEDTDIENWSANLNNHSPLSEKQQLISWLILNGKVEKAMQWFEKTLQDSATEADANSDSFAQTTQHFLNLLRFTSPEFAKVFRRKIKEFD